jgi:hypothetical protein
MRSTIRKAAVIALGAAALSAAVATPATAAPTNSNTCAVAASASASYQAKGHTAVLIDPSALDSFAYLGITMRPVSADASTANGRTTYTFTVVGDPTAGTTKHVGGIQFSANGKCLLLSELTIDMNSRLVTAEVNDGAPVDIFSVGASTSNGNTLQLTANGAAVFNGQLSLTPQLRRGFVFGYATTTLNPAV